MRALVLALLVVVPSLAGEEDSLSKAVKLFRAKDAAAREQGSRTADATLKKLLAPFLMALEDPDPEVRRRARRAILGLVPGELEKDQQLANLFQQPDHRLVLLRFRQARARLAVAEGLRQAQAEVARLQQVQAQFGPANPLHQGLVVDVQRALHRAEELESRLLIQQFGLTTRRVRPGCLQVLGVTEHSLAARFGLVKGDLVVRVDSTDVKTFKEFAAALGPQKVRVLRGGASLDLPIVR